MPSQQVEVGRPMSDPGAAGRSAGAALPPSGSGREKPGSPPKGRTSPFDSTLAANQVLSTLPPPDAAKAPSLDENFDRPHVTYAGSPEGISRLANRPHYFGVACQLAFLPAGLPPGAPDGQDAVGHPVERPAQGNNHCRIDHNTSIPL